MIVTVASRELLSLMRAPFAWTALAAAQFLLAWQFLVRIESYLSIQGRLTDAAGVGVTDLVAVPLLRLTALLLLALGPVITMRSVAGERRARTLNLPLSSPVSLVDLVLGKFLAAMVFLSLVWLFVALMIGALELGTTLDLGRLAAGMLGLALVAGTGLAAGILASSVLPQPAAAALAGAGLLLGLWSAGAGVPGDTLGALLLPTPHFDRLQKGLVNSGDIAYFLILIVFCLGFSIHLLDTDRAGAR